MKFLTTFKINNGFERWLNKNEIRNNGLEKVSREYESIVNFVQQELKW